MTRKGSGPGVEHRLGMIACDLQELAIEAYESWRCKRPSIALSLAIHDAAHELKACVETLELRLAEREKRE